VDHADFLHHLDPAGHPQGGARRLALRCLDLGRDHRRLRDPGFLFAILLIVLFAGGSFFDSSRCAG
jgi:hypothetical protein